MTYNYTQRDLHNYGVDISGKPYSKEESEKIIDSDKFIILLRYQKAVRNILNFFFSSVAKK